MKKKVNTSKKTIEPSEIKEYQFSDDFEIANTVGETVALSVDKFIENKIISGEIFNYSVFDFLKGMTNKKREETIYRLVQIQLLDYIGKVDGPKMEKWMNSYTEYKTFIRSQGNYSPDYISIKQQILLVHYLQINGYLFLNKISGDDSIKGKLFHFLFNRDGYNCVALWSKFGKADHKPEFYNEVNVNSLKIIFQTLKKPEIVKQIEKDFKKYSSKAPHVK